MPDYSTASTLAEALAVEKLDRNLFRGLHAVGSDRRPSLFGGEVMAQALRAAGLTVGHDRYPHSLHGYFLRPGRAAFPVIYEVERDRDGGSFSSRHVSAVQDGKVIFAMLASFHLDEDGPELDAMPHREVTIPEDAESQRWDGMLDYRELTPTRFDGELVYFSDHLQIRSASPLGDDSLTHACAMTYFSDFSTGFGSLNLPELALPAPSLDHSVWFHTPVRGDSWVTLELWPGKATGKRGLYFGDIRDEAGQLAAVFSQEMLVRRLGSTARPIPPGGDSAISAAQR
jgi:acyl-CoA thioesterase-2